MRFFAINYHYFEKISIFPKKKLLPQNTQLNLAPDCLFEKLNLLGRFDPKSNGGHARHIEFC
jgi:hypothetical protein